MLFEQIILGAGLNKKDFPKMSASEVKLFDSKDRLITDDVITFHDNLFAKNSYSYFRFIEFVEEKEKSVSIPESFEAKLTPDALIVHWQGCSTEIFLRF